MAKMLQLIGLTKEFCRMLRKNQPISAQDTLFQVDLALPPHHFVQYWKRPLYLTTLHLVEYDSACIAR